MRLKGAVMNDPQLDLSHWIGHGLSLAAILSTLAGLLPAIAALAAVVWYAVQIYESETCQKWLDKRRMKWKARRIAKLRAEQKVLLAELEALEVVREARVAAAEKVAVAAKDAAVLLTNQRTHEKVHNGGAVIKSTPEK